MRAPTAERSADRRGHGKSQTPRRAPPKPFTLGAAVDHDSNEKSFMDQYGDWLYISAMAFSGLGSVIAAMFGLTRARARKAALALVDQLIEVKQIAHTTKELSRLGVLEAQVEDLSTKGLRFARDNNFDEAGLAALRLADL